MLYFSRGEMRGSFTVTNGDADEIDSHGVSQKYAKNEEDPWEVWSRERKEPEERHPLVGVEATPNIHHHESEARPKEVDGYEGGQAGHKRRA
mmetsp:Transcript_53135/g.91257  ORF Transcript_53135/g.91257 Transcript_53135/m.91257 type:complete len:92 (-) Transcript_53135:359-634(-)